MHAASGGGLHHGGGQVILGVVDGDIGAELKDVVTRR